MAEKGNLTAEIDFLPDYTQEQLEDLMDRRISHAGNDTAEMFFTGIIHKKLMLLFLRETGIKADAPMGSLPRKKRMEITKLCKCFTVHIAGTGAFQQAQVCAGGVDTKEVVAGTMESRLVGDLYFAGEMLDVDGRCGGYNLQWAWTSGYLAGHHAAAGGGSKR